MRFSESLLFFSSFLFKFLWPSPSDWTRVWFKVYQISLSRVITHFQNFSYDCIREISKGSLYVFTPSWALRVRGLLEMKRRPKSPLQATELSDLESIRRTVNSPIPAGSPCLPLQDAGFLSVRKKLPSPKKAGKIVESTSQSPKVVCLAQRYTHYTPLTCRCLPAIAICL